MRAALFRRFDSLPPALRYSVLFYLAHLLCAGWIASAQVFLGLSIIAAAVALHRREMTFAGHPLYVPLALYCAASAISTTLHPNRHDPLPEIGEWFVFLAFPLALTLYRAVPALLSYGMRMLGAVGIFLASYGVIQFILFGPSLEKRIRASLSHVMTFSGIMLALSLLFLAWVARSIRDRSELPRQSPRLAGTAAVFTTVALVLTFTRGAWLGWAAGIAAAVLRIRARWAVVVVVIALVAVVASPLPLFARFVSIFDATQASNLDRIRMVEGGWEIIKDHPFFGVGVGNMKEVYPLYRLPDAPRFRIPHLHNNVVQIWSERGMFALLGYLWLIAGFAWICLRVPRDEPLRRLYADCGLAVIAGLSVAGLFEYNFGDSEVMQLTLAILALTAAGLEASLETAGATALVATTSGLEAERGSAVTESV